MADNRVRIVIEADGDDAKRTLEGVSKGFANIDQAGRSTDSGLGSLGRTVIGITGAYVSWNAVMAVSNRALLEMQQMVRVAADAQLLKAQLVGLTGSADLANKSFDWIMEFSLKNPIYELTTFQDAFVKFKAVGLDPTNGSLQSLINAAAAFGKTGPEVDRAVVAIQQMMGKGVISMEELRQQLAETIPTASQIMADKLGLSMEHFVDLVSKGALDSKLGLQALFEGLAEEYGGAVDRMIDTYDGQVGRMTLLWQLFRTQLMDYGGLDTVTASIRTVNEEINAIVSDPERLEEWGTTFSGILQRASLAALAFAEYGTKQFGVVEMRWKSIQVMMLEAFKFVAEAESMLGINMDSEITAFTSNLARLESEIAELDGTWVNQTIAFEKVRAKLVASFDEINSKVRERATVEKSEGAIIIQTEKDIQKLFDDAVKRVEAQKQAEKEAKAETKRAAAIRKKAILDGRKEELKAYNERVKEIKAIREAESKAWKEREKEAEKIDGRILAIRSKSLDKQYNELKEHVEDSRALDIWYAQEKAQIEEDALEKRRDEAEDFGEFLKYQIQLEGETWKSEQDKQLDQWKRHYGHMKDVVDETGSYITSYMSDQVFAVLKGQGTDFTTFWSGMWDTMLQAASKAIVDMAATAATNKLMELGGYLIGSFDFDDLIGGVFHSGVLDIEDDELLAKLQRGEMVVPAQQAQIIREKMAEQGADGNFFDTMAGMIGAQVDSSKAVGTPTGETGLNIATSAIRASALGAMLTGISTYGRVQNIGHAYGIDGAVVDKVAFELAVEKAMTSGITGLASNIAGGLLAEAFGISSTTVGTTSISASQLGSVLLGALNVVGSLGLPGFAIGALSPLVGLLADFALDGLDARNYEAMRDSLEDAIGDLSGRDLANRAIKNFGTTNTAWNGFTSSELESLLDAMVADPTLGPANIETATLGHAFANRYSAPGNWGGYRTSDGRFGLPGSVGLTAAGWAATQGIRERMAAMEAARSSTASDNAGNSSGNSVGSANNSREGFSGTGDGSGGPSWAGGGVVDRLIVPSGEDGIGYLKFGEGVAKKDTMTKLDTLLDLIFGRKDSGFGGLGGLVIQIVAQDGRVLEEHLIDNIFERSEAGQHVIHSRGVFVEN